MSIDELKHDAAAMTHWERRRFMLLIGIAISIALFLVSVSMNLYNNSGAAQLDLSRPGYKAVRKEASSGESNVAYPSTGPLDAEALATFKKLFAEQKAKVTSTRAFEDSAMSDDSLQLVDQPAAQ